MRPTPLCVPRRPGAPRSIMGKLSVLTRKINLMMLGGSCSPPFLTTSPTCDRTPARLHAVVRQHGGVPKTRCTGPSIWPSAKIAAENELEMPRKPTPPSDLRRPCTVPPSQPAIVTLVLGGLRSGKSSYAQRIAEPAKRVTFLATAERRDDAEMHAKIERHRAERPQGWATIEEPVNLAQTIHQAGKDTDLILIDCLTLFASNLLESCPPPRQAAATPAANRPDIVRFLHSVEHPA